MFLKKYFDFRYLEDGWNLAQPFFMVKFYNMITLRHYVVVVEGKNSTRDDPCMLTSENKYTWRLDQAKKFTKDSAEKLCKSSNPFFYIESYKV